MRFVRKLVSILSSNWFFVVVCSSVIIYASFIPFFHNIEQTPKDAVYLGTHNNPLDYPVFISEIIQAEKGRVTVLAKFTSEEQVGTIVHPLYILLGWIGGIFKAPPVFLYHLSRVIVGFLLLLSIYYFISYIFSLCKSKNAFWLRNRIKLAFFLAVFSAGIPKFIFDAKGLHFIGANLDWWTGGDVLRRATFLPHGMMKNVLLLVILVWMGKVLKGGGRKYFISSCMAAVVLGLLDPMNTLSLLAVFGLYGLYLGGKYLLERNKNVSADADLKRLLRKYSLFVVYFLLAGAALLYTTWVFNATPWKVVKEWEAKQLYTVPFWEYANNIGVTFYLGVVGMILLVWKNRNIMTFSVSFLSLGAIFFILTGVSQRVGISTLRFFQTPVYIFLAVGSAELVVGLLERFSRIIGGVLLIAAYLLILLVSAPSYQLSMADQMNEFRPWYWNIYPDRGYYEAVTWMGEHTPLDSVVFSDSLAGGIIPAISGNTVYVGHMVSTINYGEKDAKAKKFMEGLMDEKEAGMTLKEARADYVIGSWGEQYRIEAKKYPFLIKIFENNAASIFKVMKEKL